MKVNLWKPKHVSTAPVNSREARGLVAVIFDDPYSTRVRHSLLLCTLDITKVVLLECLIYVLTGLLTILECWVY